MSDARHAMRAYERQSWRRWEMDEVEPVYGQESAAPDDAATLPPHVKDELEQITRHAQEEGRAQGREEGRRIGLSQGIEEGHAQGLETGRAEGYEAGMKDALEQGAAIIEGEARRLATLLDASAGALHNIEAETGQALIRLAISISQQVIRSSLAVEPEKILDTVRDILQLDAGEDGLLRLRVHPDDLALLQEHLADDPGARRWRLQADPTIERGGCVAETSLGSIDATLQTRWQRVVGALGHNPPWFSSP